MLSINPDLRYLVVWTRDDGMVCSNGWSFDNIRDAKEWADARMTMYNIRGKRTMYEILDTLEKRIRARGWVGVVDIYMIRRNENVEKVGKEANLIEFLEI